MEQEIEPLVKHEGRADPEIALSGRIDRQSLIGAAVGGGGFWLLAALNLWLTRSDATLAAIWVPNACAVAFLLRRRLNNEIPFLAAIFLASTIANAMDRGDLAQALVFSLANVAGVTLIVWVMRRTCGLRPDMTELPHIAWLIWAGGVIGPLLSTLIASFALLPTPEGVWDNALTWFLAESMAMVLIVPTALLIADVVSQRVLPTIDAVGEAGVLLILGLLVVFLIFEQSTLPLLFLIPPITLLHAFRLGSLGTAIFVALVAVIAVVMTSLGKGPLALMGEAGVVRMHVIQGFIAANFLTGLPIAAILAGRDRMMDELETGKRQLDMLASNITDAVLRYDLAGVCTYASSSVRDVLGADPSVFIGAKASDRMHSDARKRILLTEQRLLNGESNNERFTYRRFLDAPDGSPVFIEADCAIARNPVTGERDGIVVSARDVTDRVELELLLTRARRRAENAARAKAEFLANMSHEIRTPMNGVLGFAEMILDSDLDKDQRRHARLIVESGCSMMLLLNDILDLSKIESGQISIDVEPVDLRSTIIDCVALQRPSAEKKGLELRVEFDVLNPSPVKEDASQSKGTHAISREPWVLTDGLRLRQILLNLIGNAVKFTERGHVNVHCTVDEEHVSVEVIDTGIGISQDRIESIFNPFTQAENDTTRRYGGTGLGLTISNQLAQLLSGKIEVESQPGAGSSFTLVLPASMAEPDQLPPPPSPLPAQQRSVDKGTTEALEPSRILLVEDHDINRILVTEMLGQCGQEVATAHDGHEAITMVIDSMVRGEPYDLVLMDIQMPNCDGYAATKAIRAEGIGPDTLPIIALTANAFPEDIAASREAGMQAHLAKPMEFAELAKTLQRWLPTRIVDEDEGGEDASQGRSVTVHSPEVVDLWNERRAEVIETVTSALEEEGLREGTLEKERREALAHMLHKLAGTAAMFDHSELGEHASVFERALKMDADGDILEMLAHHLLLLANEAGQSALASSTA